MSTQLDPKIKAAASRAGHINKSFINASSLQHKTLLEVFSKAFMQLRHDITANFLVWAVPTTWAWPFPREGMHHSSSDGINQGLRYFWSHVLLDPHSLGFR